MKKNTMMRIASAMLVLALITTCVISGTFAKYITTAARSDSARVAKWGVEIGIQGDSMFKNTYATDDDTVTGLTNSVVASQPVVAPGTKNETGATITVKGTPEVAFKLEFDVADGSKDVFLKAADNKYIDYTELAKTTSDGSDTYGYTKKFNLGADYYPVKYSLTGSVKIGNTTTPVALSSKKLSEIVTALEGYSAAKIEAGEEVNITLTLTWAWAFAGDDKADTLLGNLAVNPATYGSGLTVDTDYSTAISYNLTVSATQIN